MVGTAQKKAKKKNFFVCFFFLQIRVVNAFNTGVDPTAPPQMTLIRARPSFASQESQRGEQIPV